MRSWQVIGADIFIADSRDYLCTVDCYSNYFEVIEFVKLYEFENAPCTPEYPQSNGKAENAVNTIKLLMKKAKGGKTDFYLTLLEWRNTPSAVMDSSPAQRMFSRRMRTLLTMSPQLLKPETQKGVSEKLKQRK